MRETKNSKFVLKSLTAVATTDSEAVASPRASGTSTDSWLKLGNPFGSANTTQLSSATHWLNFSQNSKVKNLFDP